MDINAECVMRQVCLPMLKENCTPIKVYGSRNTVFCKNWRRNIVFRQAKACSVICMLMSTMFMLLSFNSYGADSLAKIAHKIEKASENIESNINKESVTDSLFKQIRPRAFITNNKLSAAQIDKKVYEYVEQKYTPVLIANYVKLFSVLKIAKQKLSDCKAPASLNMNEDVLISLCISIRNEKVEVKYMTNSHSQGWKEIAIYEFSMEDDNYELSSVDIVLTDGQMAHIDGI